MSLGLKKYFFIFIFLCISIVSYAQETPQNTPQNRSQDTLNDISLDMSYKDKAYDRKAIEYIISEVKKNNLTFEECLKYIKPFSKWDLQSLTSSDVWFYEQPQKASFLPNFLIGILSKYFNIPVSDVQKMPNIFLQNAANNRELYGKEALDSASGYFDLIELVKKSGSVVFLNQDNLQRANDIFYENGVYWKYVIPENSPFPVSDSVTTNILQEFSPEVISVLDKMKTLGVYAVYNDGSIIYLLKDGMLDNSYGYYFKDNDLDYRKKNHLFNIASEELLMPRFYFYIAN